MILKHKNLLRRLFLISFLKSKLKSQTKLIFSLKNKKITSNLISLNFQSSKVKFPVEFSLYIPCLIETSSKVFKKPLLSLPHNVIMTKFKVCKCWVKFRANFLTNVTWVLFSKLEIPKSINLQWLFPSKMAKHNLKLQEFKTKMIFRQSISS